MRMNNNNNNYNHNQSGSGQNNGIDERRIAESIYQQLVQSVCTEYACNVHKLIKTGQISITKLKEPSSRLELFPGLYKDSKEARQRLEQFSTEVLPGYHDKNNHDSNDKTFKRQKIMKTKSKATTSGGATIEDTTTEDEDEDDDDDENGEKNKNGERTNGKNNSHNDQNAVPSPSVSAATTTTTKSSSTSNPSLNTNLDIWGRVPPKEPKNASQCKVCGRHVSALRFASHLDKCMGLSTRPASTFSSSTVAAAAAAAAAGGGGNSSSVAPGGSTSLSRNMNNNNSNSNFL